MMAARAAGGGPAGGGGRGGPRRVPPPALPPPPRPGPPRPPARARPIPIAGSTGAARSVVPPERRRVSARGADRRQPAAVSSISSASTRVRLGSTSIPGLIVLDMVIFLRYRPLAAAGFSLLTSSSAAA